MNSLIFLIEINIEFNVNCFLVVICHFDSCHVSSKELLESWFEIFNFVSVVRFYQISSQMHNGCHMSIWHLSAVILTVLWRFFIVWRERLKDFQTFLVKHFLQVRVNYWQLFSFAILTAVTCYFKKLPLIIYKAFWNTLHMT